jgi:hypothetical protein
MRRFRKLLIPVATAGMLLAPVTVRADVVVGTFNGGGSVTLSGLSTATLFDFTTPLTANAPLDGIFSLIAPATLGSIQDVTVTPGAYAVASFITIAGYNFTLALIPAGSFSSAQCGAAAAPGQSCTVAGSALNFTNSNNGLGGLNSSLSFSFSGVVTTPAAQSFSYSGLLTSQIVGQSYQQLLATLAAGGTSNLHYSLSIAASNVTATPEPATVSLTATGLLGVAGFARRRRTRV